MCMNNLIQVLISTGKNYYPPPNCTQIVILVLMNIQQVSRNINGCNVLCIKEFCYLFDVTDCSEKGDYVEK